MKPDIPRCTFARVMSRRYVPPIGVSRDCELGREDEGQTGSRSLMPEDFVLSDR